MIDAPNIDKYPVASPIPIERSITEMGEKSLDKKATVKKMASRALSGANIVSPNENMSKDDIEDMKNDKLANVLVNQYKKKGGVEILFPDSTAEITNLGGDDNPNRNIAIVCKENSCFPVLLEFRKPNFNDFDIDIAVEGQSYTDPKIGKEQLKKTIEKHKHDGYIITKANIGMPTKNDDKNINTIYGHLASELAEIVETSKHIDGMHVEVTEYDVSQINKKGGVVFAAEIDEGGHFTSAKINDEVIPSSFAYTHKFA